MQDFYQHNPKKIGVLLVNLGTPSAPTPKYLRRFLKEFLSDRRVIEAPFLLWQIILHAIILPFRAPKSAKNYAKIWDMEAQKSPLLVGMENLTHHLSQYKNMSAYHVRFAMRYGTPSLQQVIDEMLQQNCHKILIVPLFPQYSATTTASIVDKVGSILQKIRFQPTIRFTAPYFDEQAYIEAIAAQVKPHLKAKKAKVLFLYHGLPQTYFDKGDPYHCHCQKTTRLVKEQLQLQDSQTLIAFQSRFGPKKWLHPYADDVIQQQAKDGGELIVISPGFAIDCVETLEEICIGMQEDFYAAGGKKFTYIPCLNASEHAIKMLHNITTNNLKGW